MCYLERAQLSMTDIGLSLVVGNLTFKFYVHTFWSVAVLLFNNLRILSTVFYRACAKIA